MDVKEAFQYIPFGRLLGIEITEVEDGRATGHLEMREELSSNPGGLIAHGGVTYSLADTLGGAAVVSLHRKITPTVDMRIDYLHPATDDLYAEATVVRDGGSVAVAEVDVWDENGTDVAAARGVYKTGGEPTESPWMAGAEDVVEE